MRDVKDRLRGLDAAQAPDLWTDAQQRTPREQLELPTPDRRGASRIGAGVVAIAVFIAASLFVWQAFRPGDGDVSAPGSAYTDPSFGWSVTPPPSLTLRSFGDPNLDERGGASGVAVANFSTDAVPSGDGLKPLQQFPADGVLFMLWQNSVAQMGVNTSDDTPLPLSLAAYRGIKPYVGGDEPTPLYRPLVEGGGTFVSVVWIGPQASDTDRRAIEQTVASVTFPQLEPFSVSPTSTALVLDDVSAYPVGSVTAVTPDMLRTASSESDFGAPLSQSGLYVVHGTSGYYGIPMTAQSPQTEDICHVSADPDNITFSCANGAMWNRYGKAVTPPANDDEMHGFWLFVIPVTVSWDGHLLANGGNDPRVAIEAWRSGRSPND